MCWSDRHWLGLILVFYLLVGGLYAVYTPPWQAPDEPAHYNYVRHLAERGDFPVLRPGDYPHVYLEQIKAAGFPADMSIDPIRYESWQPPLYYLLAVPVYRLWGGALIPLRLFSLALGAGIIIAAYAIGLTVRPGDGHLALGTAAFVAFVPMHLAVMASVNNDSLAELLLAVVMLRVLACLRRPTVRFRSLTITGLLLGLGLLTKATLYYVALPLVVVALVLHDWRPRHLIQRLAAVLIPAFCVAIPWYVRNVMVYGWPDLLGTMNHEQVVVGQLRSAHYLAQVGWVTYLRNLVTTTFHSFWGQFGWMAVPMDHRTYLALGLLSALVVVGWILLLWRDKGEPLWGICRGLPGEEDRPGSRTGRMAVLLGLWLLFTVFGYLVYNVTFVQFQGRYLFPALVPIGLLAVLGWRMALSRRWAWIGGSVCGLITVGNGIIQGLKGSVDKWAIVIGGGATIALFVRGWFPASWDDWITAVPLVGLAGLSVYSRFAFIVPYL